MTRLICILSLLLFATSTTAQGVDCTSDDYLEEAMAHIESHYRSFPDELFTAQLYLREGFGQAEVSPDGKWGPRTSTAVCAALVAYTEAGGSDGDWGIRRASHTPQFTGWLLTTARSNLTGDSGQSSD